MRGGVGILAALSATAIAVACSSTYGTADAPAPDAGPDANVSEPGDAGGDASTRFCPRPGVDLCLDFDGPPNAIWANQRRENGGTVDVDTSFGNPGASLHARMPAADAGAAARAQNEVSFPVHDGPMHVELDLYVKKPTPPLSVFSVVVTYWGSTAMIDTDVLPSNVDTQGAFGIYSSGPSPQNFGPSAPFPFDAWVHVALDAQFTSKVGHFKLVGPGVTLEGNPTAGDAAATYTSLTLGIARYNGATPDLDVWYDNVVVTFP